MRSKLRSIVLSKTSTQAPHEQLNWLIKAQLSWFSLYKVKKIIAWHNSKLGSHLEKRRRKRDHFAVACEFAVRFRPEFAVL